MSSKQPTGNFLDNARWNHERCSVDFTLRLNADDGEQDITCRVSEEALMDRARASGKIDPLKLYAQYRSEIWAEADRKLKRNDLEADGSILIVSGNLKPR